MATDLGLLSNTVSSILGFQATNVAETAAAAGTTLGASADTLAQTGDTAEAQAYGTAEAIANQNATLAGVSGNIQEIQQQRDVMRTVGNQQSAVAAGGFESSGSSLALLKSSLQQGYLGNQMIQTQTAMTQGGYLEQAAASGSEITAANVAAQQAGVAGQQATTLAAAQTTAATLAAGQATAETSALNTYMAGTGNTPTPETNVITGALTGTPAATELTNLNADTNQTPGSPPRITSLSTPNGMLVAPPQIINYA